MLNREGETWTGTGTNGYLLVGWVGRWEGIWEELGEIGKNNQNTLYENFKE